MTGIEIDSIDYDALTAVVVSEDYPFGVTVQITAWSGGASTEDRLRGATSIIAGPMPDGQWISSEIDPVFDTKDEAIAYAASQDNCGTIYVHDEMGRIDQRIARVQ